MNNKDRSQVKKVYSKLEELCEELKELYAREEQKLSNLPDSLSESQIGENIADKMIDIEIVINLIAEAQDALESLFDINVKNKISLLDIRDRCINKVSINSI